MLISDAKELVSDDKQVAPYAYLLEEPHLVKIREKTFLTEEEKTNGDYGIDVILTPWIVLSKDKKIPVRSDWIVTITEPIDSVAKMYEEKVNGQQSETDQDNSSDEPTTLIE